MSVSGIKTRRPDFIPRELFLSHMTSGEIDSLMSIDGKTVPGYIARESRKGTPVPRYRHEGRNLYRPIDLVARAYSRGESVSRTKQQELIAYSESLEQKVIRLMEEKERLEHLVASDGVRASVLEATHQLAGHWLHSEEEIVLACGDAPNPCGIYFLVSQGRVQYVGQSVNVFNRVSEHRRGKDFDGFSFIPCKPSQMDFLESIYIHMLRPPLNGKFNGDNGMSAPLKMDQIMQMVDSA